MMGKRHVKLASKIFIWCVFFCVIIQGLAFAYANVSQENNLSENTGSEKVILQSAYTMQAAGASIAISTRIGMGKEDSNTSNSDLRAYNYSFGDTLGHEFISQNMILIREYLNYSRANISEEIKSSSKKGETLEVFISGFGARANRANSSIESLERRKEETITRLDRASVNIENIKAQMEESFSSSNTNATLESVQEYYEQRQLYTRYFTQIVFINQFLAQYNFLVGYNAEILNTIRLNKDAIINGSFIVVPESGDEFLRSLELLFNESEIEE